jgi:hypothetical protein
MTSNYPINLTLTTEPTNWLAIGGFAIEIAIAVAILAAARCALKHWNVWL